MLHPEISADDAAAMHRVDGRVVIVTGSGQGVGRGMANHLAKAGVSVVVADYQPDKARRTVDELPSLGAARHLAVDVDIREPATVDAMVDRTVAELGRVDAIINNAQTFRANAPVAEVSAEDFDVFYRSGVLGTVRAMQAVYPHMHDAGWGRIVNFASSMGRVGGEGFGAYNASKEAIRAVTRTAAREWAADGIVVNAIAPAAAPPRAVGSEHYEAFMQACPMGRNGDPELRHRAGRAVPLLRRVPVPDRTDLHGRRRDVHVVVARGRGADWRNPWPVVGVRPGAPIPSPGVDALHGDGFVVVFDVDPVDADRDQYQDHLNNTAATRMFNELRIAYVAAHLAPRWPKHLRAEGLAVVVRELHALYETEGWMHERYVGAMRIVQRRGKAVVLEQRLVEADAARPLARCWIVQLLVGADGRVTTWPDWFFDLVADVQGAPVPVVDAPARPPWGPPA